VHLNVETSCGYLKQRHGERDPLLNLCADSADIPRVREEPLESGERRTSERVSRILCAIWKASVSQRIYERECPGRRSSLGDAEDGEHEEQY
jgi:hypothetical protein